jgi:hypothetical protein
MYRGEIQNDSNGGNYNRSLAYSPSVSGLGDGGRGETRNFAVGAPLRGSGDSAEQNIGDENEEMEDVPCWDGYEMIGTKMKKGREVPNCVPVGEGKPFTNKQLTKIILDKNKVIADLEENAYGEGFFDDVRKGLVKHNERKKGKVITEEDWKKQMADVKAPTEAWGADEGGAAPVPKKPEISPFAAGAEALKPVREAIQNGVGDLIYGKTDDPKKQRKGLLGISEEGKEESKKKVMKNIVVPLTKAAMEVKDGIVDIWDSAFNQDALKARNEEKERKRKIKAEQEIGVFRDKEGNVAKKPKGWDEKPGGAYMAGVSYVLIPNPLKAEGLRPSDRELSQAGIKLWDNGNTWVKGNEGKTLKELHNDDKIWVPEGEAKDIYKKLADFRQDSRDKNTKQPGLEDLMTVKMYKDFSKIDKSKLSEGELREYNSTADMMKEANLRSAERKVEKDIKDEEAKATPDKARLAKMKEAQARVKKTQKDNAVKSAAVAAEANRIKAEKYRAWLEENARANEQQQADDVAAFKALSPAERSAQIDAYRKDLQEQGWREEDIEEAVSQIGEQGVMAVGGAGSDDEDSDDARGASISLDDDELVGEGAIEFTLQKAGKSLFNPTGNMTMAGKQTFTPDYDAYGATVAGGRLNAFNLSRSMYNQQQAIDLPDFDLIEDNTSLRFYLKDDEDVIMVGIRGTDVKSWTDLYTWAVIGANQDFRMTTRFQDDLQKLLVFQKEYPMTQYYYVGVGSSLAGSIADRFLDMGLLDEAITYNPSIEKKYVLDGDIHNHRIFLDTDPLFILMGQYSPNTEIRVNAGKTNFYNPSKEKDYLIKSHSIFPVYNPAFEGGGMMGAGKTYTIEEWKAIFDAKLEKKRQQIEAREAKKKQTAKAKRERAKARRDGRDEPPPLETPATFRTSRIMKATPPREPEPAPPAPKKRKPRLKVVAPASARVELREELVAAQPREPEGQFAQESEPLQLVVAEIERQPQRAYMRLMKSPKLTEADRRLMVSLQRSKMAPMKKVKLLARSGLARKVMEILGIDESAFQSQRARLRIADTMEKRTTAAKVREIVLPDDIEAVFKAQEEGLISYVAERITKKKGMGESLSTMMKYTETFAKCGFGCLGLTAKCMALNPFDLYYANEMNESLDPQDKAGEKSLGLMMALTQADENYMSQVGFWTKEDRADTSMSFGRVNHERFLLPRLTDVCMGRLEGIAGIRSVYDTTRSAGMGYKRRNEWRVSFTGVSGVKKWTEAVKAEYTAKIQSEIAPKVKAIADDLKPKMLDRGEVMKERLEASLTAEQKKELADYRKGKEDETKKKKDEEATRATREKEDDEMEQRLADRQIKRIDEFEASNMAWRYELQEKQIKYARTVRGTMAENVERNVKELSSGVVSEYKLTQLLEKSQYFQLGFSCNPFFERSKRSFTDGLGNTVLFCLEWSGERKRVADQSGADFKEGITSFDTLKSHLKGHVTDSAVKKKENRQKAVRVMRFLSTSPPHINMRILSIVRSTDDGKILGTPLPRDLQGVMKLFSFKNETEDRFYTSMMRMLAGERRPAYEELGDLIRRFSIIEGSYGLSMERMWEKKGERLGDGVAFMNWAFGTSWLFPPE